MRAEVEKYFEENKGHVHLARDSLHSGVIFVAARGANVVVQLGTMILLARLLSPHDYGLVAIVTALLGFAPMLIDLGSSDASVQRSHINHVDISALFWFNVTIGSVLMLLLIGASPFVATFYGEPALTSIVLACSLTFIATALSAQHYALMRRAMQFRRIALIEILSNVVGCGVAIAMALTDWGYWALVVRVILPQTLTATGLWASCPWLPGRPQLTPAVKEMLRFGIGVTGFSMTDYLARSIDRVALGYVYGAKSLGYYQTAFLIYDNALGLVTVPLHNVAISSLSKLKNGVAELKQSWRAALSCLNFFSCLSFAGLAVTAQDLVVLLLGQKWQPAGPLLAVFAIRGIAHVTERTLGWLHVVAGRSDRWMIWGIYSACFQAVAVLTGVPFGPFGVVTAHAIATFLLAVPTLVFAGRPFGISTRDVLETVGPQIVAAMIAVSTGLAVQMLFLADSQRLMRLIISATVCLATYLSVAVGVFRLTGPIQLGFSLLHDFAATRFRRTP